MTDETDPAMDFATIAGRTRHLRALTGVELRTLARVAGVQPHHLQLIEAGHVRSPGTETLGRLAAAFGPALGADLAAWLAFGLGTPPDAAVLRAALAPQLAPRPRRGGRGGAAALAEVIRRLEQLAGALRDPAARAALTRALPLVRVAAELTADRDLPARAVEAP